MALPAIPDVCCRDVWSTSEQAWVWGSVVDMLVMSVSLVFMGAYGFICLMQQRALGQGGRERGTGIWCSVGLPWCPPPMRRVQLGCAHMPSVFFPRLGASVRDALRCCTVRACASRQWSRLSFLCRGNAAAMCPRDCGCQDSPARPCARAFNSLGVCWVHVVWVCCVQDFTLQSPILTHACLHVPWSVRLGKFLRCFQQGRPWGLLVGGVDVLRGKVHSLKF